VTVNALQLLRWEHTRARRLLAQARRGDGQARTAVLELLRRHAALEEEHIFAKLDGDDEIAGTLEDGYREHEVMEEILLDLERCPASVTEIVALLDELEETLETHVLIEEERLFPHIERAWPSSMLDEIGKTIAARRGQCQ
jgi:hypothetical protein